MDYRAIVWSFIYTILKDLRWPGYWFSGRPLSCPCLTDVARSRFCIPVMHGTLNDWFHSLIPLVLRGEYQYRVCVNILWYSLPFRFHEFNEIVHYSHCAPYLKRGWCVDYWTRFEMKKSDYWSFAPVDALVTAEAPVSISRLVRANGHRLEYPLHVWHHKSDYYLQYHPILTDRCTKSCYTDGGGSRNVMKEWKSRDKLNTRRGVTNH